MQVIVERWRDVSLEIINHPRKGLSEVDDRTRLLSLLKSISHDLCSRTRLLHDHLGLVVFALAFLAHEAIAEIRQKFSHDVLANELVVDHLATELAIRVSKAIKEHDLSLRSEQQFAKFLVLVLGFKD